MARIQAVCFDLGGVLVHVASTWAEAMTAAGMAAPAQATQPFEGLAAFKLYQAGQLDIEAYLDESAEFLGCDAVAARTIHENILMRPTSGTLEIVEGLNRSGVLTGCLSNTNALHWGVLTDAAKYPNIAALKILAASQLIGFNKPSEGAYRAFETLAGVGPGSVLFFEDGPANVEAAKVFGWHAVQIDPKGNQQKQILDALAVWGV